MAALFDLGELYDLHAAPYEPANLVDDSRYAGVKADVRRRLIEHMTPVERPADRAGKLLLYALQAGR